MVRVWLEEGVEPYEEGNLSVSTDENGRDAWLPTARERWEEIRVTSETGGEKGQKLAQLGSLDPATLLTLAEVSGFGAQKYEKHNFLKGYDWSLSFDAAQRHLLQFWAGEENDSESGLPHVAHAAWHCLAMLAFLQRGLGTDDRFKQAT